MDKGQIESIEKKADAQNIKFCKKILSKLARQKKFLKKSHGLSFVKVDGCTLDRSIFLGEFLSILCEDNQVFILLKDLLRT